MPDAAPATQAPFWCPICEWEGSELPPPALRRETGAVIYRCPGCGNDGLLQQRKAEEPVQAQERPPNDQGGPQIAHKNTDIPMLPDRQSITPLGFLEGKISVALGIVRPDHLWFFMAEEKCCFDLKSAKTFAAALQAKIAEIEGG